MTRSHRPSRRSQNFISVDRPLCLAVLLAVASCSPGGPQGETTAPGRGGKADGTGVEAGRRVEVILTDPFCDVCTADDKSWLKEHSPITRRVVALIEGARHSVDAAQFTFSVGAIKEALLAAHARPEVTVRVALDAGQDRDGSVGRALREAGVDVRFVRGGEIGSGENVRHGLMHAKFLLVDGTTVATGSNNWSSTGTSINNENTTVIEADSGDPLLAGFACHFEAIWNSDPVAAGACNAEDSEREMVFTPSGAAKYLLRDAIDGAQWTIDVLMHHLSFDDVVKALLRAARDRAVQIRLVVNAADRDEYQGGRWDDLLAEPTVQVRYKQTNPELYQLMHHKLAIVDGKMLVNGSGNWSGSGIYNNFENYIVYRDPRVVRPFRAAFARLWTWSLDAESLQTGRSAAEQHAATTRVLLGNLHAHFTARQGDRLLDDGLPRRHEDESAQTAYEVDVGENLEQAAAYAFGYARDEGRMDFLALTPHCLDDRADDPPDLASMSVDGYDALREVAAEQTDPGRFLALAGVEWSTNSTGNHVNILASAEPAKVERGRFDLLYDGFLAERAAAGDRPLMIFNHPRTMRVHEDALEGSWDQIFDTTLDQIPKAGERKNKFNDYGLDDYSPLSQVHADWVAGEVPPDRDVVAETLQNLRRASAPYVRLMEVTVARGSEIGHEQLQNPSLSVDEQGEVQRFTRVHRDWDYYLLHGFRLAPAASHDNHRANWGTGHSTRTAVLAPRLDREALLDAVDQRAVYASEAPNLQMRFYAGGRAPMGSALRTTESAVRAWAEVFDPDYDGPIELRVFHGVVGGEAVEQISTRSVAGGQRVDLTLELDQPGEHFFYLEVFEPEADRMAWSAPIWVERLD